ncbi:NAD kinase [Halovulum dunhuangense]|uniref:NAD kinase n=1 Tax=Halovulum dunhuangense TaxID=1505036 RepID=A0A849L4T5_9RHOB|nr:NAD kinase [Halovulum dunhuangense]NNU81204.1 NAD kinase [Halovulum dunhuangense]
MGYEKICFTASPAEVAQEAGRRLASRYGSVAADEADVIVALGGDGFVLATLHDTQSLGVPVYGMNRGTVGFLMNAYREEGLRERLEAAELTEIHPLTMHAVTLGGRTQDALAINEVSLLRAGPQAAKLKIFVDGRERMSELVCDGAMICTPAGSTAYNYSAHGPILPIGSNVLALTAVAAFRPRRWRGALLPSTAHVRIEVRDPDRRPVLAAADSLEVRNVVSVDIHEEQRVTHRILFDPGHGLEERLIREQFA